MPKTLFYFRNFLSTILQFQFHEALCRRAGLLDEKKALHNCDITNSRQVGTLLRLVYLLLVKIKTALQSSYFITLAFIFSLQLLILRSNHYP